MKKKEGTAEGGKGKQKGRSRSSFYSERRCVAAAESEPTGWFFPPPPLHCIEIHMYIRDNVGLGIE